MFGLHMYCDQIQCKECYRFFVFRLSTPASKYTHQVTSQRETPRLVLSCPECTHVYDYSDQTPQSVPTPWGELESRAKIPTAFSVLLECDREDCDRSLLAIAPRKAGTTKGDFLAEVPNWILHDLKCPDGHPIVLSRMLNGPDTEDGG